MHVGHFGNSRVLFCASCSIFVAFFSLSSTGFAQRFRPAEDTTSHRVFDANESQVNSLLQSAMAREMLRTEYGKRLMQEKIRKIYRPVNRERVAETLDRIGVNEGWKNGVDKLIRDFKLDQPLPPEPEPVPESDFLMTNEEWKSLIGSLDEQLIKEFPRRIQFDQTDRDFGTLLQAENLQDERLRARAQQMIDTGVINRVRQSAIKVQSDARQRGKVPPRASASRAPRRPSPSDSNAKPSGAHAKEPSGLSKQLLESAFEAFDESGVEIVAAFYGPK